MQKITIVKLLLLLSLTVLESMLDSHHGTQHRPEELHEEYETEIHPKPEQVV